MRISYLNFSAPESNISYDYFWLSLKSYVEDNYQGKNKFSWSYPIIDSNYESIDDVVDILVLEDPDILCLSAYVWNHCLISAVASKYKSIKPEVTIILGGPHQEHNQPDFFLKNSHIDFCCQTDGYGEVFFNELLYQIETDKDWSKVPYLIHKGGRSFAPHNKRSFVWPRNIFKRNIQYIRTASNNEIQNIMYEMSRGCPYGCTYCEWGGGTSSKVSFKPTEYIKEDLELLIKEFKVKNIGITDANFGIMTRDIEIAQHIANLKNTYNYPKVVVLYGPTKKNKKNLYAIEEILASNVLVDEFKVSIQDLNPAVNINIDRTDTPWSEQYESYKTLRDKHNIRIRLELMLGLPGTTIKDYYDTLDIMCDEDSFGSRYVWHLLPTSPASDPAYMEKHGIKTVNINGVTSLSGLKSDRTSLLYKAEYVEPFDIVVGANSYTTDEWVEMFIMDRIILSCEIQGFTKHICKYLNDFKGIRPRTFYNRLWNTFLNNDDYLPEHQQAIYHKIIKDCKDKVNGKVTDSIEIYELPEIYNLDFVANITAMNKFVIHINRESWYDALKNWAINEFGYDEKLIDVINWTANAVMFLDYDPYAGETFKSNYDWYTWIKTGELNERVTTNKPRDIDRGSKLDPVLIDWYKYTMEERIKRYFIAWCSESVSDHYALFKDIEVQHVN